MKMDHYSTKKQFNSKKIDIIHRLNVDPQEKEEEKMVAHIYTT